MKQLLNTLYITTPDSYLSRDGTNLVISIGGSEVGRIPAFNIEQVMCFGYAGASTSAMKLCCENNISMSFMTPHGKFLMGVHGETKGNVLLRREQYRIADDESRAIQIGRNMIAGKVANSRQLIRKSRSNHMDRLDTPLINDSISVLTASLDQIRASDNCGSLRGFEGDASRTYFKVFDSLILVDKEDFFFRCRNRRPPRDRVNSLLSFVYSMLMRDVESALEAVGLDPYVGFIHTDRPGRPSLALDLMEELRPLADRVVISLINLRKVKSDGFIEEAGGAVTMTDETRRIVIDAWQTRKNTEVNHPFLKERVKLGLVPHIQSMLLAKCIRGELEKYPPFLIPQAIL